MPYISDWLQYHYPAFAELRDRRGMQTICADRDGPHWIVVLADAKFWLSIGDDRQDWHFDIDVEGRHIYHSIPRVLHQLGFGATLMSDRTPANLHASSRNTCRRFWTRFKTTRSAQSSDQ